MLNFNNLHMTSARNTKKGNASSGIQSGKYGPIYFQFKNKPQDAIKHLRKVKQGECIACLYNAHIGYIDIIWGNHDDTTGKGKGLAHIIGKHEKEIKEL